MEVSICGQVAIQTRATPQKAGWYTGLPPTTALDLLTECACASVEDEADGELEEAVVDVVAMLP
ncbi:hypothetical protein, partial [Streptomyces sp. NPDC002758]